LFFFMFLRPPCSTLFPYTTLFRSSLPCAVAADTPKPELLVVYWASKDCRWCSYWESPSSGMEKRFKESREFKRITYRVVKNERLADPRSEEHTSELQSRSDLVCRLLLEKKKQRVP